MSDRFVVDPPELDLLLKQLRLPTMRALWRSFTERARPRGVAHRPPARRACQPRGHRPRAPALRAAPGRGEAAAGQDARQLRLHPRACGLEGARARAGERRCLARGRGERAAVRASGDGQEPLGRGPRARTGRERVPGPLPAHGGAGAETPDGAARPRPSKPRSASSTSTTS